MKRILAAAISLAVVLVGIVAVPAQAQSLRHPRGCDTRSGYETSFGEVTELICDEEYKGGGDFSKYTNLTFLRLADFPDAKLSSLPKLPASLEDLRIGDLTSTDWSAVYALPNLTIFSTYGSAVSPDFSRLSQSSPNLEHLRIVPRRWADLTAVRTMKNLRSFQFLYSQPGIAATVMVKTPVANLALKDISGKPLKFQSAGTFGKNTSKGVSFEVEGDHDVEFAGDEYEAKAYLPNLEMWLVSQDVTVRVRDYADLKYWPVADRGYLDGGNRVGQRLEFIDHTPFDYEAFQWMRNGVAIKGAANSSYEQTTADIGQTISLKYTHARGYFPGSANSPKDDRYFIPVSAIAKAPGTTRGVMTKAVAPTVSGARKVNSVVKAKPNHGLPGVTVKYQWYRNGKAIKKATKASYRLQTGDYGKKVSVKTTATKKDYVSSTKKSASFKPSARPLGAKKSPKITGTLKGGKTLKVKAGTWAAKPSKVRYQWYLDGTAWHGETKSTFKLPSSYEKQKVQVRAYALKPGYTESTAAKSKTVTAKANLKYEPVKKPKKTCTTFKIEDLQGNSVGIFSCRVN